MKPLFQLVSPNNDNIIGVSKSNANNWHEIAGWPQYKSPNEDSEPIGLLNEINELKANELGFQSTGEMKFYIPDGIKNRDDANEILLIIA